MMWGVVVLLGAVVIGAIVYGLFLYDPAPWDDDSEN